MPTCSLPRRRPVLTVWLQPNVERSPTDRRAVETVLQPRSFGGGLKPRYIFGARKLDQ